MKLLITNVVYGEKYPGLFLNHHLPYLLDPTNLPMFKKDIRYMIFTDIETEPLLRKHPNVMSLHSHCEVEFRDFTWKPGVDRFAHRYGLLVRTFQQGVQAALQDELNPCMLAAWTADMVLAKDFIPKVMGHMERGHDAVFMFPPRAAAESLGNSLMDKPALDAMNLWKLVIDHQHPLFLHAHWRSPTFTRQPFYLLWNTGIGMLARIFSVTPVIMKPTMEMAKTQHVIDIKIPSMFKNPYWATDWDDAPVAQVEPIHCYQPVHRNFPANIPMMRKWASERDPSCLPYLEKRFFYPNRLIANVDAETMKESDEVVQNILGGMTDK